MGFKGTKSKWECLYDGLDYCYDIVSDYGLICSTMSAGIKDRYNALLISKSPILLQAIYDSIKPLRDAGLKEMADYHEKIYIESINL